MYSIKYSDGVEVSSSLYEIDIKKKTFYSISGGLLIDFEGYDGWSFDTSWYCTFKTGRDCKFDIGYNCKLNIGDNCELKCWFDEKYHYHKLNNGSHVYGEKNLYRDIDKNWALLNSRHNEPFIRKICKEILTF